MERLLARLPEEFLHGLPARTFGQELRAGATTGFITGAVADILVVTGGTAGAVILVSAAAGAVGSAAGTAVGNSIAGKPIKDGIMEDALIGAVFGALGGAITGELKSLSTLAKENGRSVLGQASHMFQIEKGKWISSAATEFLNNLNAFLAKHGIDSFISSV